MANRKSLLLVAIMAILVSACGGGGGSSGNTSTGGSTTPGDTSTGGGSGDSGDDALADPAPDVKFRISDAAAIMQVDPSNLVKWTNAGSLEPVFQTEEYLYVDWYYIAPDNNLYVLFYSDQQQFDGQKCRLVRFTMNDEVTCMDGDVSGIAFNNSAKLVYLDSQGNVYYAGMTSSSVGFVRKFSPASGETSELYRADEYMLNIFANSDGYVYVHSRIDAENKYFLRQIAPDGTVVTLATDVDVNAMFELPDGRVYIGFTGGVIAADGNGLDAEYFINANDPTADFDTSNNFYDSCEGANQDANEEFCSSEGASVSSYYLDSDGRFYAVVGFTAESASAWVYWPSIMPLITLIIDPVSIKGFKNFIFIMGEDIGGHLSVDMLNTTTHASMRLVNGSEIEVDQFDFDPVSGLLLFAGYRNSDGEYVLATSDSSDNARINVLEVGTKYEDIQTFK